ncbi:acyl carrier protein [Nocardia sp. CNY236]|uniref:acyl carrier protein n=1 Tax=Nocardia sp. CNY236 TaxID=1169152 RepID=UPI00048FA19F|nr:acyl carrier protein [Nocardia sp. CNY236]
MSDKLIEMFAAGLKVDAVQLSEGTSPENTAQWDSLATMTLVMLLEDSFEVTLSTQDIMRMHSIGAAREILRAKGVGGI